MRANGSGRRAAKLGLEALEDRETPAVVGTLDPTFGTGGKTSELSGVFSFGGQGAVVDSAGRTVVAGNDFGLNLYVTRFTAGGALDTSFGTGGEVRIPVGQQVLGAGVVADAAGGLVLTGQAGAGGPMVVARLTAAGALDPAFGTGGVLLVPAPAGYSEVFARTLTFDPAGNLVVAGAAGRGVGPSALLVVRLTPSGAVDPAFNGGVARVVDGPAVGASYAQAVTVDGAGRIVVAGSGGLTPDLWVTRLTPGGALDATFAGTGTAGVVLTSTYNDNAQAVATDAAGNVYVGATASGRGVVLKLTAAGVPDPTFGTNGRFFSPLGRGAGPFDGLDGLALLPDGRLLAAQTIAGGDDGRDDRFGVFLLTPDGRLDPAFNPAGVVPGAAVVRFDVPFSRVRGLGLTPEGDVIVAGFGARAGYDQAHPSVALAARLALATGTGPPALTNPLAAADDGEFRTATADVNGDGVLDTLLATGPGGPTRVAVVSGADGSVLLAPFDPFGDGFTGGAFVAAGDFDGDGRAEYVVAADVGGGPRVVVVGRSSDGTVATWASFFGIEDGGFRGGARVAVGDLNRDGTPDLIVAAGFGGGPRVAVYDGRSLVGGAPTRLVADFFAFPGADMETMRNGVTIAAGDVDGDGFADLIVGAGGGAAPRVLVVRGATLTAGMVGVAPPLVNCFVGDPTGRDGVRVGVTDDDADGRDDVVVGNGTGALTDVRVFPSVTFVHAGDGAESFPLDPDGEGAFALGVIDSIRVG